MQKTKQYALKALAATAVCSAFGFLARWAQNMSIFEEGTRLATPGAMTTWMLVLFSLGVMVGMAVFLLPTLGYGISAAPYRDIRGDGKVYQFICFAAGAVMCIAGAIIFIQAAADSIPILSRVLGILAVFTGFGIVCIGKGRKYRANDSICAFGSIVAPLFCCFWLIVSYKDHSANPVVWQYAVEVLAISVAAVTSYFIAGFIYGRPRVFHTAYSCAIGTYGCFAALGDSRPFAYQMLFAALGAFFIITLYELLLSQDPINKRFAHIKEN